MVVRRGTAPTLDVAGLTTDAECAVVTDAGGADEQVFLLGASFAEGDGVGRQAVPAGSPWSARREHGRWVVRPTQDRVPE